MGVSSAATATQRLADALADAVGTLRPPDIVMRPEMLGAVRLTRYSFNRMFLRRAAADGWTVTRTRFEIDETGAGEAAYQLDFGDATDAVTFVAFTRTLSEDQHTDRVIAERWEISACLVDGAVTDDLLATLRAEIPRQEAARLDPRVLVLTRGNRSVRFFEYLVDTLAAGRQPDPELVGDSGYIMRSTAFYANGKYGMRSFEGYPPEHPLAVPYRAQFAAAWLFRELSYDVVEHCAEQRGGPSAVRFDESWSRFFGLGNATGLGLVPYAFKHPRVIHSWVAVRELALAGVRAMDPTTLQREALSKWIERARRHLATGTSDECVPFRSPQELRPSLDAIATAWAAIDDDESRPFDRLYRWAEDTDDAETIEWVVSLLVELSELDDDLVDAWHRVGDDLNALAHSTTLAQVAGLLEDRWNWLDDLDLDGAEADTFWWVISDNTEEPRRVRRARLDPEGRDVAIDVALRMARFRAAVGAGNEGQSIGEFLDDHPEHRLAASRLASADDAYGEPHDNSCDANYLPLQVQRLQLAQYGMDNFKPKSTDWLRVTLNQGAPRATDLNRGRAADGWVLPPRPETP